MISPISEDKFFITPGRLALTQAKQSCSNALIVIPAQAGIQASDYHCHLDPGLRRDDGGFGP
jgi:hypothetical protein